MQIPIIDGLVKDRLCLVLYKSSLQCCLTELEDLLRADAEAEIVVNVLYAWLQTEIDKAARSIESVESQLQVHRLRSSPLQPCRKGKAAAGQSPEPAPDTDRRRQAATGAPDRQP